LERTSNTTGLIKNCKIGDFVITLGPDCAAAGARLVIEAKEKAEYSLIDARAEIEKGRENRDAQCGLFVFSSKTAPPGSESFARFGCDVFVVWDAEDARSDLYLHAGLEMSRALCLRIARQTAAQTADFTAIDAAILEVEKKSNSLDQITTWAETIRRNGDNIIDHIRKARNSLERQVSVLQEKVADLKQSVEGSQAQ
jgi:hypothetical protein